VGLPLDQLESNTFPLVKAAPTYCTVTVSLNVAVWPVPTTRSLVTRVVGAAPVLGEMTGSIFKLVALATAGTAPPAEAADVLVLEPAAAVVVDELLLELDELVVGALVVLVADELAEGELVLLQAARPNGRATRAARAR
jgi:hypothetical protein